MFTRCPECETTFRLGAQDLRRAGGKVRCGECATVFNALEYLEEEAEQVSPVNNPWQTEPATDEPGEPDDGHVARDSGRGATDTLYDDDYEGPIGDDAESQGDYPGAEPCFDEDADEDDGPDDETGAGILVTDPDDDYLSDNYSNQAKYGDTESNLDSAAEDSASAYESEPEPVAAQEHWSGYTEQDDDDDIVSFITPMHSRADYPEVSPEVSAAIGISQITESADLDNEDENSADDAAAWSDEPAISFEDELDINAADDTVEFIISGDEDDTGDTEAQFIPVLSADDEYEPDDEDDHTVPQTAVTVNDNPDADSDEFDDTIWERIPGVGSSVAATDQPLFASSGPEQPESSEETAPSSEQRLEPVILDGTNDADTTPAAYRLDEGEGTEEPDADTDNLEFNAPADTWSSIFSRATRAARRPDASGDTRPLPVIPEKRAAVDPEELDAWSRELDAGDSPGEHGHPDAVEDEEAVLAADDRTDWVSELSDHGAGDEPGEEQAEWLAEDGKNDRGESSSAPVADFDDWEDWVTEESERNASVEALQQNPAAENSSDQPEELATPDEGVALKEEQDESTAAESTSESGDDIASLTAAFATGEYDEEEYDVQHIVLADESEPDSAGLTQAFAVPGQAEIPPWQPGMPEQSPAQNSRASLWLVAGVLVVAALALQLVHYNRDALAGSVAWGETIRGVYHRLGMELYPNWSIDDYEIRGSEAIAGESGPDIMDIRAQIAAIGKEPVGLPHILVVLNDRWSNPVAKKVLSPAEYAVPDSLPPDALLKPGETLAAHISIIDPGSGAQGFELELCLPRRNTGLQCTGRPFE